MKGLAVMGKKTLKTFWLLICVLSSMFCSAGDKRAPANSVEHGKNWTIPGLAMKFVYIAPGSFRMGSNDGTKDEKPVHTVIISKAYWAGRYEVTQNEYQFIMGTNPAYFKGGSNPVECVSWNDAVKFCKKLTARERKAGRLPSAYEYRLLTEAEWEFAARGGNKSQGYKYSGGNNLDRVAWYGGNSGKRPHKVGTKAANELGIHDMSGNVWEWCLDTCGKSGMLAGITTDTYRNGIIDPVNIDSFHVFRGGGWLRGAEHCRVAKRAANSAGFRLYYLGFRVALARTI